MQGFRLCVLYLVSIGILSHFWGEAIPRTWMDPDRKFFALRPFEKGGQFYEMLHIRDWKDKFPDKSRYIKSMNPKRLTGRPTAREIETFIQETCVSEFVHTVLIIAGFWCMSIWPEGGLAVSLLWGIGNLPYICIQRYVRPQLRRLYALLERKEKRENAAMPAAKNPERTEHTEDVCAR